jgi:quercetin dioxygenase-like cupin family protein
MTVPATERVAHLVDPHSTETVSILGPTLEYLTAPESDTGPCVLRGTIPPRGAVPLHSHSDPETFLLLSGEAEGLCVSDDGYAWVPVRPGDVFHVPGGARHAWRNPSLEPMVSIIVTTGKLGRFFREVGRLLDDAGTPEEELKRFLATADRYGYWNATPEENAEVGLYL